MIYKKVVAGFIAITVCLSIGVSSSFGMWPPRGCVSGTTPPQKLKPTPHIKPVYKKNSYQYTYSWSEMGIDATMIGVTAGGGIAKKIATKFGKLSTVQKIAGAQKISGIAGIIAGKVTANELKNKSGIKIKITWENLDHEACYCGNALSHGGFTLMITNIDVEFSIV